MDGFCRYPPRSSFASLSLEPPPLKWPVEASLFLLFKSFVLPSLHRDDMEVWDSGKRGKNRWQSWALLSAASAPPYSTRGPDSPGRWLTLEPWSVLTARPCAWTWLLSRSQSAIIRNMGYSWHSPYFLNGNLSVTQGNGALIWTQSPKKTRKYPDAHKVKTALFRLPFGE